MRRILLVDNYDSYTYNLANLVAQSKSCLLSIIYNDDAIWAALTDDELLCRLEQEFTGVMLSPGPGSPTVPSVSNVCSPAMIVI